MHSINRFVAIIKPRQAFPGWLKSMPDGILILLSNHSEMTVMHSLYLNMTLMIRQSIISSEIIGIYLSCCFLTSILMNPYGLRRGREVFFTNGLISRYIQLSMIW